MSLFLRLRQVGVYWVVDQGCWSFFVFFMCQYYESGGHRIQGIENTYYSQEVLRLKIIFHYDNNMNKILIISAFIILTNTSTICSPLQQFNQDQLWSLTKLHDFERYYILSAGALSILGLILTIATWSLYPSLSIPSDIMLLIMVSELVENTALLSSALYSTFHTEDTVPTDFETACTAIGVFFILGNISTLVYNLLFCLILSHSVTQTLKGSLFSQKRYHLLAIFTISAAVVAISVSNNVGTGFNGICGYKIANRQSIARFVVELIISALCLYSMYRFKSKVPKNEYFNKEVVFGYYYYYMGIYSFFQIGTTISYMVSSISCRTGSSYTSDIVRVSIAFSVCFSILLSYFQIFIRLNHPILKIKLKAKFCCNDSFLADNIDEIDEDIWLGSLLQSIKGSQIISFMTGILIGFSQHQHKIPTKMTPYHFNKSYVLKLNENITDLYIMKNINYRMSVLIKQKLDGLRTLEYEVTFFAPQMFTKMAIKEATTLLNSFDLDKNIEMVKKSSHTNGGKSGQFFFGTYDNKFVFKTVKKEEAKVYLERLSDFYEYYDRNEDSLIVKILGVYKFVRKDIQESPMFIILMKNVSPVQKKYQIRIYDIKGSEFNRSTLEERDIHDSSLSKYTLKDIDFKNLEGRVTITTKQSDYLKKILKRDLQFLGKMGVMDYSLLIIKRKGPAQNGMFVSQVRSKGREDEFYNIGIIDYLQSWNLKRKAERALKTLVTTKEVTATSPEDYSRRLGDFIDKIL